ncbi:MAG: ketopantoate reductase [Subtercola sp.]|nr:ketopantoate reductase [Subtercola sp.]
MKILIYGAGVLGSIYAARLHDAGHDVSLVARGQRLVALREHGILLAEGDSPVIRSVRVPVVEAATGQFDLTLVFVRTHHVDAVLESIARLDAAGGSAGDVLFLLNWAAGAEPLSTAIGRERVLLGFATQGGTMHGDVVHYRPASLLTRLVSMPIGEPDGRTTPRVEQIVELFRAAGFGAKPESRMESWLTTHAAFEVPLGQAVHAAGGLEALAGDPRAIRLMLGQMRLNLASLPSRPVPRAFTALQIVPWWMLVPVFRRFLRSSAAVPLSTDSPAVFAELDALAEQLRARAALGAAADVSSPNRSVR